MIRGGNVELHHRSGSFAIIPMDPVYDSAKDEIVFGRGSIGEPRNYDVRTSFNIGFNDARVSRREAATTFLYRAGGVVENILSDTTSRCRELGFI
jgi:hypothetical protein